MAPFNTKMFKIKIKFCSYIYIRPKFTVLNSSLCDILKMEIA